MTAITSGKIAVSQLTLLDKSKLRITKLTDEEIAHLNSFSAEMYKRPVNLADHPSQKAYAEVQVNGKTVARLYNSGAMETSNAAYGSIRNLPSMNNDMTGPELAQLRADEIAKKLGGKVVKASTAITQQQWLATPPVRFETDFAAMARDVKEAKANSGRQSSTTLYLAQLLAQNGYQV